MDERLYYSWQQLNKDITYIVKLVRNYNIGIIFGFSRGGLIPAVMLSNHLNVPLETDFSKLSKCKLKNENIILIDDISDSGKTMLGIKDINKYRTVSLYIKNSTKFKPNIYCHECDDDIWVVFPWERKNSLTRRDDTLKND